MTTGIKKRVINDLINKGKSSEYFREEEALRLIKKGKNIYGFTHDFKRLITPDRPLDLLVRPCPVSDQFYFTIIRCLTSVRITDNGQLEPSILPSANALRVAKSKELKLRQRHSDSLSAILIMKAYSKNASYPSLIIDATRTIIKIFSKLGHIKTLTLNLYEAVVYDDDRNHTFTACKNNSHYWFWIPKCYIRIDVSHFVKNLTKWLPFKTVSKRVKEIYLRVLCLIIKIQRLSEIKSLLLSIFVVASNETSGGNVETGIETPCSKHKNKLIEVPSGSFTSYTNEFQDIISASEIVDKSTDDIIQQDDDVLNGIEDSANSFKSWVDSIHTDSINYKEEGTDLKPFALLYDNDIEKCTSSISEDPIDNSDNYPMVNGVYTFPKPVYDNSDGSNSNQSLNSAYVLQNNTLTQHNDELHIQEQPINLKKNSSDEQDSGQFNILHQKHVILPLLKNGSRAEDLKALNLKGYGKIILTNTCAFDTAVPLFMAAICDSYKYLKRIDQFPGNSFIAFTKTILSTGISVDTRCVNKVMRLIFL
ncbi:Uncharacterized protein FWK35_00022377 [Aphis craccivora]|uniref:Uncharacterized protein n=1 Tax=Aphis craccivora TaxID=307492 RepID=A0A6G0XYY7_APHCR|nr:Uncharacterized protein FWK35_00022377 [Aphis craccivora]